MKSSQRGYGENSKKLVLLGGGESGIVTFAWGEYVCTQSLILGTITTRDFEIVLFYNFILVK